MASYHEQVLRRVFELHKLDRHKHVAWLERWGFYGTSMGTFKGGLWHLYRAFVGPLLEPLLLAALVDQ